MDKETEPEKTGHAVRTTTMKLLLDEGCSDSEVKDFATDISLEAQLS